MDQKEKRLQMFSSKAIAHLLISFPSALNVLVWRQERKALIFKAP